MASQEVGAVVLTEHITMCFVSASTTSSFPLLPFSADGFMVRILFASTSVHQVYQQLLIRFGSFGKAVECILSIHRYFARCGRRWGRQGGSLDLPWADIQAASLFSVSEHGSHRSPCPPSGIGEPVRAALFSFLPVLNYLNALQKNDGQ